MKTLEINTYGVQHLNHSELIKINGGVPLSVLISGAVALGATAAWIFEKGEQLGRALAKKH